VESDRSKGDDSNDATSDVPIAVLDVNATRPSDLLRDRRVLWGVPSDTHAAAGAGDALSQRARRRDRVQLGAECVRAQPANAVEARALAAARHARAAPSDTRDVAGAGDKLSQRARRRDRVKLGGECVRAQPAAAADARAPMPRFMQRWSFPPTTAS